MGTCCSSDDKDATRRAPPPDAVASAARAREAHTKKTETEVQHALNADIRRITAQKHPKSAPQPARAPPIVLPLVSAPMREVAPMLFTQATPIEQVSGVDEDCSCYIQAVAPFLNGTRVCVGLGVVRIGQLECRDMQLAAVVQALKNTSRPFKLELAADSFNSVVTVSHMFDSDGPLGIQVGFNPASTSSPLRYSAVYRTRDTGAEACAARAMDLVTTRLNRQVTAIRGDTVESMVQAAHEQHLIEEEDHELEFERESSTRSNARQPMRRVRAGLTKKLQEKENQK